VTTSTATKRKKHPDKAKLDDLLQKFRIAVKQQIANFKSSKVHSDGYYYSDITGYKITKSKNVQVNHVHPRTFRQLAYDFIKSRGIDLDSIEFLQDYELNQVLEDWKKFHAKNAVLNILTASQNKYEWLSNRANDIPYTRFYTN